MFNKFAAVAITLAMTFLPLAPTVSADTFNNPITNPSLETAGTMADGTAGPAGWTHNDWSVAGTQVATYDYVNEGHDGGKSIKVTMSGYTDGDAKWFYTPITNLEVGKQYRFNAWYKSSAGVVPKAVAMFVMADGTEKYFGMPNPQPNASAATTWTKYSDTFSVPQGAVSVSTFFFINQNGWIQTDDYSIESYTPTGFSQPMVTLTFDDGHEDNVTNGLPVLEQYGFKTTQCFATEFIEGVGTQAQDNVLAFYNKGHEICSHTVSHPQLTSVDATQLNYELQHSKDYLESVIPTHVVPNFASPYGDYNENVNNVIKGIYASHRTVDEGYNSKDNYDPYRLRVQNIFDTTTAAQVSAWVAQAQADKTWLILVYHRIVDTSKAAEAGYEAPGQFDSALVDFKAQMAAIAASNIKVATLQDALTQTKAEMNGTVPTPSPTPTPTPAPGVKPSDVNGDGTVDALDLSTLLSNWDKAGATFAQGNVNNDGTVDALDLSAVLANWSK